LIVEDNLPLSAVLQIMLEEEGHEVRCAADSREGYRRILFFQPDVVITDLHLPGGNGLDMMQRVRRVNPGVKAIYMSADLSPFHARLREETDRYPVRILPKPFSREDLLDLLAALGNGGEGRLALASREPLGMAERTGE